MIPAIQNWSIKYQNETFSKNTILQQARFYSFFKISPQHNYENWSSLQNVYFSNIILSIQLSGEY